MNTDTGNDLVLWGNVSLPDSVSPQTLCGVSGPHWVRLEIALSGTNNKFIAHCQQKLFDYHKLIRILNKIVPQTVLILCEINESAKYNFKPLWFHKIENTDVDMKIWWFTQTNMFTFECIHDMILNKCVWKTCTSHEICARSAVFCICDGLTEVALAYVVKGSLIANGPIMQLSGCQGSGLGRYSNSNSNSKSFIAIIVHTCHSINLQTALEPVW